MTVPNSLNLDQAQYVVVPNLVPQYGWSDDNSRHKRKNSYEYNDTWITRINWVRLYWHLVYLQGRIQDFCKGGSYV